MHRIARPLRPAHSLVLLAAGLATLLAGSAPAQAAPDGYCAYSHPVPPSPVKEVVVCTP